MKICWITIGLGTNVRKNGERGDTQPHPGYRADPCDSVSSTVLSRPSEAVGEPHSFLLCTNDFPSPTWHSTCVRRSQDAVPLMEHVSLTAYSAHTMHMGPENQIMLMSWVGKNIQRSPQRDGERSVDKLLLWWNHGRKRNGRSVPQKGPSEESWLRDRCLTLTVKSLQSNALASFLRPLLSGKRLYYELATASQKTGAASLIGL